MSAFAPDLVVSVRFSLIFHGEALAVPRLGVRNVHPGELPRCASLFSPFWTMPEGRESIGCTVHRAPDRPGRGRRPGPRHRPAPR
ncbi:formyltransferase family protein [Kitasatospora phosalacinea]|uniref:formyltransferase family protein n=1 Tax=Kitasatospora phosalacinea TaxID=2065 RepID=UPI0033267D46